MHTGKLNLIPRLSVEPQTDLAHRTGPNMIQHGELKLEATIFVQQ